MQFGIAFGGKMGSGKTACANYLIGHAGFTRISLADGIKEIAAIHQNLPEDQWPEALNEWLAETLAPLDYPVEKLNDFYEAFMEGFRRYPKVEPGQKNRGLLQYLGTEAGRSVDRNVWINILKHRVQPIEYPVVDDVRFPNELEVLHSLGFWTIYLEAPSRVRLERIKLRGDTSLTLEEMENHPSETELDRIRTSFRQTIYNDDGMSMANLHQLLRETLKAVCPQIGMHLLDRMEATG